VICRQAHIGPLLSGPLQDLVASGAATWRDGDGMVGGDRMVVVEAGERLAAVMNDCDCLEKERKEKVLTERISHFH
jgi:hypothetical protein